MEETRTRRRTRSARDAIVNLAERIFVPWKLCGTRYRLVGAIYALLSFERVNIEGVRLKGPKERYSKIAFDGEVFQVL